MFTAANAFITTLFTALNSFALALKHIAGWTEQTAGAFADESALNRIAAKNKLLADLQITHAQATAAE